MTLAMCHQGVRNFIIIARPIALSKQTGFRSFNLIVFLSLRDISEWIAEWTTDF